MAAKVLDGRYKLIKVLGVGGFGRTYVARDMRRPGSPICVVKQLKPASDDPTFIREARRLFNTEAETLEKLGKHDRIPQLLAYFEEENQFFLVQEFIEGQSLYDEMKPPQPETSAEPEDTPKDANNSGSAPQQDRQLSEPEVLSMLQDTLHVLEFVHAEGVIHRDIKPENLIRRKSDDKLVLIDFGAVKALQESGSKLETTNGESRFTVTIGTPGYMPSEQCAGRPNFSSDIYAVGMLAIKALTGFSPTDLPTDADTGELVWRDRTKVSNGMAMVLTRMVRYHYNQRYQSVKEVQQALSAFAITEEQKQRDSAGSSAIVKASAASQSGGIAAPRTTKPQPQSNTSSGLLLAVLLLVVGITAFTVPILLRPQKSSVTTTPIPTIGAGTPNPQPPTPNPQPPTPQPNPTASPGNTTQSPTFSQGLTLKAGEEKIEEGSLKADLIKSYTFDAKEGQELKTELTSEHITMSVVGPDKENLATQTSAWSGKLRFNGTYQIQLKASKDNAESNYKLKVILTEPDAPATRTIEITPAPTPKPN